jgi:mRNA interferase MazF
MDAPTSTRALPASFRTEVIIDGEVTRVLIEQLGAVDARRIGELIGRLGVEEQWVDEPLIDVLALH